MHHITMKTNLYYFILTLLFSFLSYCCPKSGPDICRKSSRLYVFPINLSSFHVGIFICFIGTVLTTNKLSDILEHVIRAHKQR
jgi:hypothetical protein